jgi:hypothetical protein
MVSETHRIMANINTLVNEKFSIGHTVIQFESNVCSEEIEGLKNSGI